MKVMFATSSITRVPDGPAFTPVYAYSNPFSKETATMRQLNELKHWLMSTQSVPAAAGILDGSLLLIFDAIDDASNILPRRGTLSLEQAEVTQSFRLIEGKVNELHRMTARWQDSGELVAKLLEPLEHVAWSHIVTLLTLHLQRLRRLLAQPSPSFPMGSDSVSFREGKSFWTDSFGEATPIVASPVFLRALAAHSPSGILTAEVSANVLLALDCAGSGFVHSISFRNFLAAFGPSLHLALEHAADSLAQSWFVGYLGKDTAEHLLLKRRPGTFLLRFASSQPHLLAVSYVTEDCKVTSYPIETRGLSGYSLGSHTYKSLRQLVESNAAVLRVSVCARLGCARYFHGFIDFDETSRRLRDQKPGTFLIRFSRSKPGSMVVAWVAAPRDARQSIISCEHPSGGYVVGDGPLFMSLEALLFSLASTLQQPCSLSEFLPDLQEAQAKYSSISGEASRYSAMRPGDVAEDEECGFSIPNAARLLDQLRGGVAGSGVGAGDLALKLCKICRLRDFEACIIPCGHVACMDCAEKLKLIWHPLCPLCGMDVTTTTKVYRP